jgi:hypothetical protein
MGSSRNLAALFLTMSAALAVTGPEEPLLLLLVPAMRQLAAPLVPVGVGLVKAANLLTLEVACSLHHSCEHPRHETILRKGDEARLEVMPESDIQRLLRISGDGFAFTPEMLLGCNILHTRQAEYF